MQIDEKLYAEIKQYCELNGLKIKTFISEILRKAFNREKFGDGPFQMRRETPLPITSPEVIDEKKVIVYDIVTPTIENKKETIPIINNKVEIIEEKIENKENLNKTKKRKLN